MQIKIPYKTKQFFLLAIKIMIVIGCGFYIWNRLTSKRAISNELFSDFFLENNSFTALHVVLLIALTVINWFFEILKWHQLVSLVHRNTFKESIQQSLASLTVSLVTPNRIGEYGAKALFFKKNLTKKIVGLNLIGNVSQLGTTLFFGSIGYLYVAEIVSFDLDKFAVFYTTFFMLFLLLIIWMLKKKELFFKKFTKYFQLISKKIAMNIVLYSVLRYVVFSHQFYLFIYFFNIDITYFTSMACISLMYLISSIIPALSLFDVVIKSSVAVWVFSFFSVDGLLILIITTCMWLLNFVLPSIIGAYYVLRFNTSKLISN